MGKWIDCIGAVDPSPQGLVDSQHGLSWDASQDAFPCKDHSSSYATFQLEAQHCTTSAIHKFCPDHPLWGNCPKLWVIVQNYYYCYCY